MDTNVSTTPVDFQTVIAKYKELGSVTLTAKALKLHTTVVSSTLKSNGFEIKRGRKRTLKCKLNS